MQSDSKSKCQNVKGDVTIVGFMCYMILGGKLAMAKARTKARRPRSRLRESRFMRAFAQLRPAGRAPRGTHTAGTSAYFRC